MREITMRPTRSLVRAALSASLLSTLPPVLGVSAMLAECSVAIAGGNVLKEFRPVTDDMLQRPDPGDWLMRRGDYRGWGYRAVGQNRAGNVGALKLAWAWNMEPGYQEEAPLVHDGVIFFLANSQNVVQALDGRTGDLLWEYRRELPKIEVLSQRPVRPGARHDRALRRQGLPGERGCACRGARRADRQGRVGQHGGRLSPGLHVHQRSHGRQGQGDRRHFGLHQPRHGRRVLHCRPRCEHRSAAVANPNDRPTGLARR